jgi:uncharacterized 2Fe-2S/4Fe-4S cluster protein (DUF4445 family)
MEPKCFRHPEVTGKYYCSKYNRYMCEECLACLDPNIYCKFRKMCMIWEIAKYGTPEQQEKAYAGKKEKTEGGEKPLSVNIRFVPTDKTFRVDTGTTIMDAARDNEVYINARCGGKGVCGSCRVRVESGSVDSRPTALFTEEDSEKGFVLACTAKLTGDVTVEVPDENRARALKIVEDASHIKEKLLHQREIIPLVKIVPIELVPPTLDDPSSDLDRTRQAFRSKGIDIPDPCISLGALSELSSELRKHHWKVNIALLDRGFTREIIRTTRYSSEEKYYGLAVDMGTTSVVAYLVEFPGAEVVGVASTQNRQVVCGEDVISRIICAKGEEGMERFHGHAIKTINDLVDELVTVAKIHHDQILSFVVAGNTVMTQAVLRLDPSSIRTEPYVPVAVRFPVWHAGDIGIKIHPLAGLYIIPGNAAYVGGDITSGIVASGLNRHDDVIMFIDVGTNGEMVLGNKEWMLTASCSAGPAFEGGGIRHGMRALPGAIDVVEINPETFEAECSTIDDLPAAGICGSGMITLMGNMFLSGVIDSSGKFNEKIDSKRIRKGDYGLEYVLSREEENGLEEDICITESDISILMQSKAAVYSGITTLLKSGGMTMDAISRFYVAGGFGKYIDFEMAVVMGLFPDVDLDKFEYLGNSSVAGAYLALVSEEARNELVDVSKKMTYVDFSSSNLFFDEYQQAMFLPHTEHQSFPTVMEKLKSVQGV